MSHILLASVWFLVGVWFFISERKTKDPDYGWALSAIIIGNVWLATG